MSAAKDVEPTPQASIVVVAVRAAYVDPSLDQNILSTSKPTESSAAFHVEGYLDINLDVLAQVNIYFTILILSLILSN